MKKGLIVISVLVLLLVLGGLIYWYGWQPTPEKPAPSEPGKTEEPSAEKPTPEKKPRLSAAQRYCREDHDKSKTGSLAKQGGLTQILKQQDDIDAMYDCAEAYLDNGGDINARDEDQLTPLFIAIQKNDARMVKFLLKHKADPRQRAGKKDLRAYGYAVYRAMHDQKDYNDVIEQLDAAMER